MNIGTILKKTTLLCTLIGLVSISTIVKAEDFKFVHVLEEGYWYSRYNLGSLVMKSGLGEKFKPNKEMVKKMIAMVSDDVSKAVPAKGPALLKRVFNSGVPHYAVALNGDPKDFENQRWLSNDSSGPTTLESFGWTLMKEIEWTKQFNIDSHFGIPNESEIPGAQQRFAGLVLCAEAMMQIKEFNTNKEAFDLTDRGGKYVALAAISNFSKYVSTPTLLDMKTNRCAKSAATMNQTTALEVAKQTLVTADGIYNSLEVPEGVRELSLAIQGLTWYGAASSENREEVKNKIDNYGTRLSIVQTTDPVELGYLIRGLVEASRVTGKSKYMKLVGRNYKKLAADFDTANGIFKSKNIYSTEDVAVIIGALNAAKLFAESRVDQTQLESIFISFFNTVINKAQMQISAPPAELIPAYERKTDVMLHRHPSLPVPPKAGGDYGIAPVFAASVTFANGTFSADKNNFDTAGAFHLANEMIWFHHGEVNGFPEF